ncbi:MAG: hypothetical protein O2800_05645 [Planctomycetota bacterium]|nr:hypothetical protein [Planctomycetota bacterium]
MRCPSCGYPTSNNVSPCTECGVSPLRWQSGRPESMRGTIVGFMFLRSWRAGSWLVGPSGVPMRRGRVVFLSCIVLVAWLFIAGKTHVVQTAVAGEYQRTRSINEYPPFVKNLDAGLVSHSMRSTGLVWQHNEIGVARDATGMCIALFCVLGGWMMTCFLVFKVFLRSARKHLDLSEWAAAHEASHVLAAAICVVQVIWLISWQTAAVIGQFATATTLATPVVVFVQSVAWFSAFILVPVGCVLLAVRGDPPKGAIRSVPIAAITTRLGSVAVVCMSLLARLIVSNFFRPLSMLAKP